MPDGDVFYESDHVVGFKTLRELNVGAKIEKRGKFSYLSWAWAVDQLLLQDPSATWEYTFFDGKPYIFMGDMTAMVFCTVRAFGVTRTAQLPVMDYKNAPIQDPDSFEINTAMQRCLAKAIALHGIGLYIYAGEDLPPASEDSSIDFPPEDEPTTAPKFMGAAECKTINNLAKRAKVDTAVICDAYGVAEISFIPLGEFSEIVDRLQKKAKELE